MDDFTLLALAGAAVVGLLAVLAMIRRDQPATAAAGESMFAVSSEGMTRCPKCGTGNLVTDGTCSNCGKRLHG